VIENEIRTYFPTSRKTLCVQNRNYSEQT